MNKLRIVAGRDRTHTDRMPVSHVTTSPNALISIWDLLIWYRKSSKLINLITFRHNRFYWLSYIQFKAYVYRTFENMRLFYFSFVKKNSGRKVCHLCSQGVQSYFEWLYLTAISEVKFKNWYFGKRFFENPGRFQAFLGILELSKSMTTKLVTAISPVGVG